MPCDKVDMPDGVTAIICSRGQRQSTCVVCKRAGGLLCDYPLSGPKAGKTCDRGLCAKHTFRPAPETDYCPAHAEMHREHLAAIKASLGAGGPR